MKKSIFLGLLFVTTLGFSQEGFDVNALQSHVFLSDYSFLQNRKEESLKQLSRLPFFDDGESTFNKFEIDSFYVNYRISLRMMNEYLEENHPRVDLFFGFGYRKAVTNGNMFFVEKWDPDLVFIKTYYYKESEIISVNGKIMFWSNPKKTFFIGIGLFASLGYEFKSNFVKKRFRYVIEDSIAVASKKLTSINEQRFKTESNIVFLASIPIEFGFRFSKDPENFLHRTKFIIAINHGIQQSIVYEKGYFASFSNLGFGLQIGF